jgi:hypothetical protein
MINQSSLVLVSNGCSSWLFLPLCFTSGSFAVDNSVGLKSYFFKFPLLFFFCVVLFLSTAKSCGLPFVFSYLKILFSLIFMLHTCLFLGKTMRAFCIIMAILFLHYYFFFLVSTTVFSVLLLLFNRFFKSA